MPSVEGQATMQIIAVRHMCSREDGFGAEDWDGADHECWWHSEGLVTILMHFGYELALGSFE